ncbi:MAG: tyrosine-type recombinase/integrase, partial [Candidatus Saccharimonadales bacterium]
ALFPQRAFFVALHYYLISKKNSMQKQQTTVLRGAAEDLPTIVEQACDKVNGFSDLIQEMDKSITINGKSRSTYDNYTRQLAHLALHFNQFPLDLTAAQVTDYLYLIKKRDNVSKSFFRFTVFGMRYACKMRGLEYQQFNLPIVRHNQTLPVVLNNGEIKGLLEAYRPLKQRLILGLLFGCGLRMSELRHLEISHIDLQRGMLHVHQGKRSKDRCLPLGKMLGRGIETYLVAFNPVKYLFENREKVMVSAACIQGIIKTAVKKAKIDKTVSAHSLRHSFATHLLEQGVNIMTIKDLLGHKRLQTTMIYLHVIQPRDSKVINPLDTLYQQ